MQKKEEIPLLARHKIVALINKQTINQREFQSLAHSLSSSSLHPLKTNITQHDKMMKYLKCLTLIHNLILSEGKNKESELEEAINLVCPEESALRSPFDKHLMEKLVLPYKFYLLKRNLLREKEMALQVQPFALINLIKTALTFIEMIYTLGRYLYRQYKFVSEFNVIMARDLTRIYRKLTMVTDQSFWKKHLDIFDKLHEGLYVVFYNCYFSKKVMFLAPLWVDTQVLAGEDAGLQKNGSFLKYGQLGHNNTEGKHTNKSLCLESCQSSSLELRTAETIPSHHQIKEQGIKPTEIKERLQFIEMASLLLNNFKQDNLQSQKISRQRVF